MRIGTVRVVATAIAALAMLCFSQVAAFAEDPLTNQAVIEMVKLGLGDAVIVKKIKSSPTAFDTGLASLKALKEAGVSDAVIGEMMSAGEAQPAAAAPAPAAATAESGRPAWSPKKAGVYFDRASSDDAPKLERIEPTSYDVKQGSGMATAWFSAAKTKTRVRLVGDASSTEVPGPEPTFYFVLSGASPEQAEQPAGNDPMSQAMAMVSKMQGSQEAASPKEYVLVKLATKKGSREFVAGSYNAFGSQSGVEDESVILLRLEEVAEGIYRVRARKPLDPGEYCFYRSTGNVKSAGAFGGSPNSVFDFSIR